MAVLTLPAAADLCAAVRQQGGIVVATNGHFDLLHVGHLHYLEAARALGDALFVGINDDDASQQQKGAGRPLVPADERARLVAALKPVTAAVVFTGETAADLLAVLRPDVYVKGGDYRTKHLPERAMVEAAGGRVVLIDYLPDHSTTALIQRVQRLTEEKS